MRTFLEVKIYHWRDSCGHQVHHFIYHSSISKCAVSSGERCVVYCSILIWTDVIWTKLLCQTFINHFHHDCDTPHCVWKIPGLLLQHRLNGGHQGRVWGPGLEEGESWYLLFYRLCSEAVSPPWLGYNFCVLCCPGLSQTVEPGQVFEPVTCPLGLHYSVLKEGRA